MLKREAETLSNKSKWFLSPSSAVERDYIKEIFND